MQDNSCFQVLQEVAKVSFFYPPVINLVGEDFVLSPEAIIIDYLTFSRRSPLYREKIFRDWSTTTATGRKAQLF